MTSPAVSPLLLLVSGPSGSGKTTLCARLVEEVASVTYSVSCTTRPARPGEVNGQDYIFLDKAEFQLRVDDGAFLEHAMVHGHAYGTLWETVLDTLTGGKDLVMDIDVQGAAQLRERVGQAAPGDLLRESLVDVFIAPPSMATLDRRLRNRGEDEVRVIEQRMQTAEVEMVQWREYAYVIVNDALDDSYGVLRSILTAEHHRVREGKVLDVR